MDNSPAGKQNELTHELLSRGLCVNASGEVLLCRRKDAPQRSFLPGGHIDRGEGARAALEREIGEELSLPSRAGAFLGAAEHFFGPGSDTTFEMNVVFALEIPALASGGEPASAEPWQEFFWCAPERLSEAGFEPKCLRAPLREWAAKASAESREGGTRGARAAAFASAYETAPGESGR
ncbi:MAG: NUDIX domain-containing protein [Kiritimatiellae bacterium]|nr:NUDIX domain-containing protein [Kiritimatiellia bacterium]